MNVDVLHNRFAVWKYILFMNCGASFTLFIQAVLHYLDSGSLLFPISWYGAWCIVFLASFLPGFVLLLGKHWMQLPLPERINTIFGYFAVAWFTLLPVGVRMGPYTTKSSNFFLLICGVALAVSFVWLRRKTQNTEIFP